VIQRWGTLALFCGAAATAQAAAPDWEHLPEHLPAWPAPSGETLSLAERTALLPTELVATRYWGDYLWHGTHQDRELVIELTAPGSDGAIGIPASNLSLRTPDGDGGGWSSSDDVQWGVDELEPGRRYRVRVQGAQGTVAPFENLLALRSPSWVPFFDTALEIDQWVSEVSLYHPNLSATGSSSGASCTSGSVRQGCVIAPVCSHPDGSPVTPREMSAAVTRDTPIPPAGAQALVSTGASCDALHARVPATEPALVFAFAQSLRQAPTAAQGRSIRVALPALLGVRAMIRVAPGMSHGEVL
jgi:hypothetical protein